MCIRDRDGTGLGALSEGEGAGTGLHDEITGVLTPAGKQRLQSGHRLAVDDLRWFDDLLLMPYCSYEVHFLARFTNELSQRLNAKYDLPHQKAAARWPWRRVLSHMRQIALLEDATIGQKFSEAKKMFRFNLRFLAAVRVACPLAMAIVHYVVPRGLLGYYRYLLLALLAFLVFRNTTYLIFILKTI